MDSTYKSQSILSLCPGILGLERGVERAINSLRGIRTNRERGETLQQEVHSINTVAYVEIEAFIIANLVAQMESGILDPKPIWTNVKTFDAWPFCGKVHGIIGGYPCQPFSHAGERRGVEDERHLFPYILKSIKIIGPEFVYFENVAGHLSMGYEEVRRSLSDIGYRVEEGIFTAEEVGAPHRRERLFILGVMENAGIIRWRRWCLANPGRSQCEIQATGPGTSLGDSEGDNEWRDRLSGQAGRIQNRGSSNELADTYIDDTRTGLENFSKSQRKSISQENQRERNRNEFGACNTDVANPGSTRNEIGLSGPKQREERVAGEFDNSGNEHRFPAGQGTYQYAWEQPRTIESSMVYTVNGYNFTEDLHRAIGNSVVEQVSELAFITLLDKHIKNL